MTFPYAGDANALLEQRFDRKLWLRQMGWEVGLIYGIVCIVGYVEQCLVMKLVISG